jgi:hypothetical protein
VQYERNVTTSDKIVRQFQKAKSTAIGLAVMWVGVTPASWPAWPKDTTPRLHMTQKNKPSMLRRDIELKSIFFAGGCKFIDGHDNKTYQVIDTSKLRPFVCIDAKPIIEIQGDKCMWVRNAYVTPAYEQHRNELNAKQPQRRSASCVPPKLRPNMTAVGRTLRPRLTRQCGVKHAHSVPNDPHAALCRRSRRRGGKHRCIRGRDHRVGADRFREREQMNLDRLSQLLRTRIEHR